MKAYLFDTQGGEYALILHPNKGETALLRIEPADPCGDKPVRTFEALAYMRLLQHDGTQFAYHVSVQGRESFDDTMRLLMHGYINVDNFTDEHQFSAEFDELFFSMLEGCRYFAIEGTIKGKWETRMFPIPDAPSSLHLLH